MSGHHDGSPFIQHHYDDAKHQFESGKLGMWLFLAQEILFFSALFVAYIVYRSHHPEIFYYAHKYLDVTWGATNTVVLLLSSLTAAWAVRAAQLGQRKLLIGCIIVTIGCACAFMGIKYVEYSHKFHDGLVYGAKFAPKVDPHHVKFPTDKDGKPIFKEKELAEYYGEEAAATEEGPHAGQIGGGKVAQPVEARGSQSLAPKKPHLGTATDGHHGGGDGRAVAPPPNTNMFFTIYFAMTGLHGLHVTIGIFVFLWLLWRAIKGHFTPEYFGPIDYAALYWHLVDLIWIYLFPLLYLIH
jgi:cytochrome c oxidase subunit 3